MENLRFNLISNLITGKIVRLPTFNSPYYINNRWKLISIEKPRFPGWIDCSPKTVLNPYGENGSRSI